MSEDMRTEPVEGAPISMLKVSKMIDDQPAPKPDLHVLIENEGFGFVNDCPGMIEMNANDREMQAMYYLGLGLPYPPYLKEHLDYMFDCDTEAMYKYAATNVEMKQLIGFIQLFGGSLKQATKAGANLRMWIVEPETHLHPKRQAKFMTLFNRLKDKYGMPPTTPISPAI